MSEQLKGNFPQFAEQLGVLEKEKENLRAELHDAEVREEKLQKLLTNAE